MQMHKKVSDGIGFATKDDYEYDGQQYQADLQHGDVVTILDGGVVEEGKFGDSHNFQIETRNGKKKLSFNQKSVNVLVDSWGDESEEWIGKKVNIILKKDVIAGKKVKIVYIVPDGWLLDDYGDLTNEETVTIDDL